MLALGETPVNREFYFEADHGVMVQSKA